MTDQTYGKPLHGWSCDCPECQRYEAAGQPRPGEVPPTEHVRQEYLNGEVRCAACRRVWPCPASPTADAPATPENAERPVTPGCLACAGVRTVHIAGCPYDCIAREGCTGDYHRADCPRQNADQPYKDGVLQPGWMLDPVCDHDYAPCPFCPPIRTPQSTDAPGEKR